jgi:hypothetical protein
MPSFRAFWRNDPSVRFVILASLTTGVLTFECARSSFTSSFVYSRRTVLLFVFLATGVSPEGEQPSSTSNVLFPSRFPPCNAWTRVVRAALDGQRPVSSYPFLRFGNWGQNYAHYYPRLCDCFHGPHKDRWGVWGLFLLVKMSVRPPLRYFAMAIGMYLAALPWVASRRPCAC